MQDAVVCHTPLESQVCVDSDAGSHRVVPGTQTPTHAPPKQAFVVHGAVSFQVPVGSQAWTVCPEHCVVPGEQVPVQTPSEQTSAQTEVVCQAPLGSHF